MQINIDRKTGVLLGVIVLLAAAVLSLSINRSDNNPMNGLSGHMGHGSSGSTNSNYTGADVMFLQMMIPHHQQAIDISNLAMKSSQDPELLALAKIIARDQAAEIKQMKAWLKDAGASEDMGHSMDGMGGMLSADELSALQAATGKEFDILWLTGMTDHHDGAIHMTQMIEDAQNAEIKAFGEKVIADQSAQIEQMKEMLRRIS
ncbi:MAG: hypothetical protein RL130_1025 [Actinomycetota bacterium]|jgi:uncharacterized protein (DUF305 family)